MNEFENAVKNDFTAAEYYRQFDCPSLRRLLLNRIGVKGLMLEDFSPTGKVSVLHPLVSVAMPEIQNNPAWKDIAESVNPAEQWHQYLRILQQIALFIKKDIAKELEQASLIHVVPDEEGLPVFLVSEPEYIDGIDAGADFLYDDFRSNLRGETEPNFDTERELYDFLRTEAGKAYDEEDFEKCYYRVTRKTVAVFFEFHAAQAFVNRHPDRKMSIEKYSGDRFPDGNRIGRLLAVLNGNI